MSGPGLRRFIALLFIALLPEFAFADDSGARYWRVFERDARSVLGRLRADLHAPDTPVAGAALMFVSAPGAVAIDGPDFAALAGCRPHSCDEKGMALIRKEDMRLLAVGLRHFRCRWIGSRDGKIVEHQDNRGAPTTCNRLATLSVFVIRWPSRQNESASEHEAIKLIRQWATQFDWQNEDLQVVSADQGVR